MVDKSVLMYCFPTTKFYSAHVLHLCSGSKYPFVTRYVLMNELWGGWARPRHLGPVYFAFFYHLVNLTFFVLSPRQWQLVIVILQLGFHLSPGYPRGSFCSCLQMQQTFPSPNIDLQKFSSHSRYLEQWNNFWCWHKNIQSVGDWLGIVFISHTFESWILLQPRPSSCLWQGTSARHLTDELKK